MLVFRIMYENLGNICFNNSFKNDSMIENILYIRFNKNVLVFF